MKKPVHLNSYTCKINLVGRWFHNNSENFVVLFFENILYTTNTVTWKIIEFKYVTLFKQATFNSTTPISVYKGGAFEHLTYHCKVLDTCPIMSAGDVII